MQALKKQSLTISSQIAQDFIENRDEKMSLLIINSSRATLVDMCEAFGQDYCVDIAFDVDDGKKKYTAKEYDLVLACISANTGDPVELCRHITRISPRDLLPVIVHADYEDEKEERALLSLGILDYVDMWTSLDILYCRVRNHMAMLQKNKTLTVLSSLDSLTGLYDKRLFYSRAEVEWQHAERSNSPLSILVVDIDDFKLFNDGFGHLEGDLCLKHVAKTLGQCASRKDDWVFRFGGEEFALLLPHTDEEGAGRLARLALNKIADLCIPQVKSAKYKYVTVSIGCATCRPTYNSLSIGTPKTLFEQADKMMYEAKQKGKNCYVSTYSK
jgi:diguanylate cyclase (GGDEF)-like protein